MISGRTIIGNLASLIGAMLFWIPYFGILLTVVGMRLCYLQEQQRETKHFFNIIGLSVGALGFALNAVVLMILFVVWVVI